MHYYVTNGTSYLNIQNRTYAFSKITGTVQDSGISKVVKTHTYSSGGGGNITISNGNGSGHIDPIQISSTNSVHQEFWLKAEDGSEHSIMLDDCDIPIKPGHKITMVTANLVNSNDSWWAILVNHTIKKHYYLPDVDRHLVRSKLQASIIASIAAGIAGSFAIGFIFPTESSNLVFFAIVAIVIAAFSWKRFFVPMFSIFQFSDLKKSKEMLNSLAQTLYENA